ncbi:MAG TPA: hypothetical protein VFP84_26095 [Kofleriaceae bacterium]|nr:hypothetical protein [Kofleriaceae bacterium]
MTRFGFLLAALLPITACVVEHDHHNGGLPDDPSDDVCATADQLVVDTGASVSYAVGVDAGYYAFYTGNGHWHIEWTCDTKLSALGCNFTGSITYDTATSGAKPTCFNCEADDIVDTSTQGAQTRIDFDTLTSTGIDGLDFESVPGHPVQLDLEIDGFVQNDLVFVPSQGRTRSPVCMPLELTPSAP